MPESKSPFDQHSPVKLFIPFDVLAIQSRRRSLGLPKVENGDPRLEEAGSLLSNPMPLVKDNIIWPTYVQICERQGIEPYSAENEIEVTVDPETLAILEY